MSSGLQHPKICGLGWWDESCTGKDLEGSSHGRIVRCYTTICFEGLLNATRKSLRTASIPAEIRTRHVQIILFSSFRTVQCRRTHTLAGWHRTKGILTRVRTACYATCTCLFVASGCLCHYIQHTSWEAERGRRNRAICRLVWTIVVHHHVHNSQQLNPSYFAQLQWNTILIISSHLRRLYLSD